MRRGRRSFGFGARVGVENELSIRIPAFARTSTGWWILRREEIRNLPFAGPARAYACWRRNSNARVMLSVIKPWRNCCTGWITVCRPIKRSWKGASTRIENQQFEYINRKAQRYLKQGEPVISVAPEKKELVGDFKNPGREWHPQGKPEPVRVHDFEIRQPENGKVAPYGVYDLGRNAG